MNVTIHALPIVMSKSEALRIASGEKNPIVRTMARNKKINLRLMYLEHRYLIYEMTYHNNVLNRMIQKETVEEKQKIRILVDATTCTASYTSDPIYTEEIEVDAASGMIEIL